MQKWTLFLYVDAGKNFYYIQTIRLMFLKRTVHPKIIKYIFSLSHLEFFFFYQSLILVWGAYFRDMSHGDFFYLILNIMGLNCALLVGSTLYHIIHYIYMIKKNTTMFLKIIDWCYCEQFCVGKKVVPARNWSQLVCGLFCVTGSWFLERDVTDEFFKCIFGAIIYISDTTSRCMEENSPKVPKLQCRRPIKNITIETKKKR